MLSRIVTAKVYRVAIVRFNELAHSIVDPIGIRVSLSGHPTARQRRAFVSSPEAQLEVAAQEDLLPFVR